MSDDEADPELLALLRAHLGIGPRNPLLPPETGVLESAQHVVDNAVDVAIDMIGTKAAAEQIYQSMLVQNFGVAKWAEHELHPKSKDEETVRFIFLVDLLNFSFWSEQSEQDRFQIEYQGTRWTGYWSLCAAIWRAKDEGLHIIDPSFWHSEEFTEDTLRNVFRSATAEEMPLLEERYRILRDASEVLCKNYDMDIFKLLKEANKSAAGLVNLLADKFACFRDEVKFERRTVRFLKRAQIFVGDLWAAFEGQGHGEFHDIDKITTFPDYRIPQILNSMGALVYSPPLEAAIGKGRIIQRESDWEVQIRGCSIACVEAIRKEILRLHPEAKVNAILIDFFLYDTMKQIEADGEQQVLPHHRTRTVWY